MNIVYFTKDQVDKGLLVKALELLNEQSNMSDGLFNDIHIMPGGVQGTFVLEWEATPYKEVDWGARFKLVQGDEIIATEVVFPDNSTVLLARGEAEEALKQWKMDNPDYIETI